MSTLRRYHHGDLRAALVAAATAMLEEEGHEALSLREAARRACVSHNAPYRHFADREALLAAVAAEGFRALAVAMAAASGAGRVALRGVGEAYVAFAVARPRLFALMFGAGLDIAAHAELQEAMDSVFAHLAAGFGARGGDDPRPAMIAAWSVVHGLAHLLIDARLGPRLTSGRDIPALTRAVLDAFAAGIAKP